MRHWTSETPDILSGEEVICPVHGPFERRPAEMLFKGAGCPACCRKPRPKRGPQFREAEWQVALVREVLRERRFGHRLG